MELLPAGATRFARLKLRPHSSGLSFAVRNNTWCNHRSSAAPFNRSKRGLSPPTLKTVSTVTDPMNAFDGSLLAETNIAILIPCYNEEITITDVINQFRQQLPHAAIYVFDNNSTDRTVEMARNAGAIVVHERRQGKGYVVQSMFKKVDADIYVMVDGDGTYPAEAIDSLMEPILTGRADMVIGSRLHQTANSEFRLRNRLGNYMFRFILNRIFAVKLTDLLSGYRVFNRRLVRSIPLFAGGFETEAEMTIKSLERGFSIVEIPVDLTHRPAGSHSKIRIVQDGLLILRTIVTLFRDYRPLTFFGGVGLAVIIMGCIPGTWVILDYIRTGLVPRLPSALLAVALVLLGTIFIVVGIILHTISRRFQELDFQLQRFVPDTSSTLHPGFGQSDGKHRF
jgi:glycosyltransferase involved in cell wall biosynthesis